jgi:hypothetical protein
MTYRGVAGQPPQAGRGGEAPAGKSRVPFEAIFIQYREYKKWASD